MTGKGDLFVPIYEREAMWIKFESSRPFTIKMYTGGVNVVSGELVSEALATMLRRKQRMSEGKTIQDYIVSESQASQKWIDGVTTIDGTIFQFVGTPSASGYFVDSQIAGKDSLGIPMAQQRLIYGGCQLADSKSKMIDIEILTTSGGIDKKLSDYNITHESVVHLNLRHFASGSLDPEDLALEKKNADGMAENTVTPREFTNQAIVKDPIPADEWDLQNTILFNLQLMNASTFEAVLGIKAPKTPITASLYRKYRYPFMKSYEELGGINGIAEVQKKRGKKRKWEESDSIREAEPNTVDGERPFLPVSEMELVLANVELEQDI
ncbi:hypothetical protein DL95DRAFT_410099 [Leptodontidium sp. 2 PMI_412]|nr:hypothetical protein DL95DRAFT_410099 [Leptodontidium sp. 2 PMI_412]